MSQSSAIYDAQKHSDPSASPDAMDTSTEKNAGTVAQNGFLRKLALTLIIVAVMVASAEGLARVIAVAGQYNPENSDEFNDKRKVAEKACSAPALIFLGSSYTDNAIYAELLQEQLFRAKLPLEVRNLAMIGEGGAPSVQYRLLKTAMDHGTKPAMVFCDVSPFFGFLADGRTRTPTARIPSYLIAYRGRFGTLLRNLPDVLLAPNTVSSGNFIAKRFSMSPYGYTPVTGMASASAVKDSLEIRKNLISTRKFNPEFYQGFAAIRQLCVAQNVPLVFVWFPTLPGSDELYESKGVSPALFQDRFKTIAHAWGVKFISLHGSLDPINFSDCDHLNTLGAQRVTSAMARLLSSEPFRSELKSRLERAQ